MKTPPLSQQREPDPKAVAWADKNDWFGTDIQFSEDGFVEWDSTPITSYDDVDVMMDVWDVEQEQMHHHPDEILLEEFLY